MSHKQTSLVTHILKIYLLSVVVLCIAGCSENPNSPETAQDKLNGKWDIQISGTTYNSMPVTATSTSFSWMGTVYNNPKYDDHKVSASKTTSSGGSSYTTYISLNISGTWNTISGYIMISIPGLPTSSSNVYATRSK